AGPARAGPPAGHPARRRGPLPPLPPAARHPLSRSLFSGERRLFPADRLRPGGGPRRVRFPPRLAARGATACHLPHGLRLGGAGRAAATRPAARRVALGRSRRARPVAPGAGGAVAGAGQGGPAARLRPVQAAAVAAAAVPDGRALLPAAVEFAPPVAGRLVVADCVAGGAGLLRGGPDGAGSAAAGSPAVPRLHCLARA